VLRRLADLGVEKVSYSGGEPLVHPKIGDIVSLADNLGLKQIVTTNGDVIARKVPPYLEKMEYVKVSFYGVEELHNKLMGKGHFRLLQKVVHGLKDRDIEVGVNYMLSKPSLGDVSSFLEICRELAVNHVLLQTYIGSGDSNDGFEISKEDIQSIANFVSNLGYHFDIKIHNYKESGFYIVLDENLNLTLPSSKRNSAFVMGSLFDSILRKPDFTPGPARKLLEEVWELRRCTMAIIA
jgi:MoaA/NifB/PqqE/SkfB family radical SAM enzyme